MLKAGKMMRFFFSYSPNLPHVHVASSFPEPVNGAETAQACSYSEIFQKDPIFLGTRMEERYIN